MTVQVHEFGYVSFIEKYGSDESVICAARTSTQRGFQGWGDETRPGDERLLKFLWQNGHVSPFEFAGLVVEIRCPLFVRSQLVRHWSLSVNEASARYAPLPEEDYLPTVERLLRHASGSNKQANRATGAPELTEESAAGWLAFLEKLQGDAQATYEYGLSVGVPKELARIALTVARYTTIRLNGNLRDWIFVLGKRLADDAQEETRQTLEPVGALVAEHFPRTWSLFEEWKR